MAMIEFFKDVTWESCQHFAASKLDSLQIDAGDTLDCFKLLSR